MLALALRYWRPLAGCLAALAVVGAVWYQVHAYGDRREADGADRMERHYRGVIQRRDEEDAKALDTIKREFVSREAVYQQRISVIESDYVQAQDKLNAARVSNARLVQRVRDLIAANSRPADGAVTDPGGAVDPARVTELPAGPTGDLVEFAAACADTREREAAHLRALIAAVLARQGG